MVKQTDKRHIKLCITQGLSLVCVICTCWCAHAYQLRDAFNVCLYAEPYNSKHVERNDVPDWMACIFMYCQNHLFDPGTRKATYLLDGYFQTDNLLRIYRSRTNEKIYDGCDKRSAITGQCVRWDQVAHIVLQVVPGDQLRFEVTNYDGAGGFIGRWEYYKQNSPVRQGPFYTAPATFDNSDRVFFSPVAGGWPPHILNDPNTRWVYDATAVNRQWCRNCITNYYWTAPSLELGDADACRWFRRLRANNGQGITQRDLGAMFQELKNFAATQQLEYVRDQVITQLAPPPDLGQTEYAGFKAAVIRPKLAYSRAQREWQLFVWDVFNSTGYQTSTYLYDHFANACSFFESEYSRRDTLCRPSTLPLPYDMLAASLLASDSMAINTREYLYGRKFNKTQQYFFVRQPEQAAFVSRYAKNPPTQLRAYNNVAPEQLGLTYIRNLTNAVPLAAPPDNKLFDNKSSFIFNQDTGIPYLVSQYTMVTALSLTRLGLFQSLVNRLADTTIPAPLGGDKITQHAGYLGLLAHESNRRFDDIHWLQQLDKRPLTAVLRELANMYALQSVLKFETLSRIEQIEALFANNLAYTIGALEKTPTQKKQAGS